MTRVGPAAVEHGTSDLGIGSRVGFWLGDPTERRYSRVKGFAAGATAEKSTPRLAPIRNAGYGARVGEGAEFAERDLTAE